MPYPPYNWMPPMNGDYPPPQNAVASTLSGLLRNSQAEGETQRMTEMAAARLEGLGPQGAQWAGQIRKDPRAALQLADAYGGFGEIENRLHGARSQGEWADSLQGTELKPEELQIMIEAGPVKGPAALKAYREANGAGVDVKTFEGPDGYEYQLNPDGTSRRISGQGAPRVEQKDRATRKDALGRYRFVDSGELVFPDDENAKPSRFTGDRIDRMRRDRNPVFKEFRDTSRALNEWESIDFENPANDAKLVKIFVQRVEPGLQVTSAEGDAVSVEATSGAGQLSNRIAGLIQAEGHVTDEARDLMRQSVEDSFDAAARNYDDLYQGMEAENEDMFGDDEEAKVEAMAGSRAAISRIRKRLAGKSGESDEIEAAAQALRDQGIEPTPEAVADLLESISGSDTIQPAPPQPDRPPTLDEIRRIAGGRP